MKAGSEEEQKTNNNDSTQAGNSKNGTTVTILNVSIVKTLLVLHLVDLLN